MTIHTTRLAGTNQFTVSVTGIRKMCDETSNTLKVVDDYTGDSNSLYPSPDAAFAAGYFWATENLD